MNIENTIKRFPGDYFTKAETTSAISTAVSTQAASQAEGVFAVETLQADQLVLSDLNTAPASTDATGVKGTIIVAADGIYVCVDTDTWVKADLATWGA
jgi:hypothetical protein